MKPKIIPMQRSVEKIRYPQHYDTDYIFTYYKFNVELKELIDKSGYAEIFKKDYFKALRFLQDLKTNCFEMKKIFEKLKNADGIYSMKLKGEKNIRILFIFRKNCLDDIVILLYCFEEKETRDYKDAIQIAKLRINELEKLWRGNND